jgi:ABC-type branched-subunit amino acid transport system substrate-binding protein
VATPRRVAAIVGSATLALSLAACGSAASASGDGGNGSANPGVNTKTKTVEIGASVQKTGPAASFYPDIKSAKAAIAYVNAHGGVNGWKIKFDELDDAYDPTRAVANVKKLVQQNHVLAVVCNAGTTTSRATFPYLEANHVPSIGIIAETGVLQGKYSKGGIFGTIPAYGYTAAFMTDFIANHLKVKSMALAYQDDDSGAAAVPGATWEARKAGIDIVTKVPMPTSATDYSSYAAKLKASHAPAVLLWGVPSQMEAVIRDANTIGYHPKWIIPSHAIDKTFYSNLGPLTKNVYLDFPFNPTANSAGIKAAKQQITKYAGIDNITPLDYYGWINMHEFIHALDVATKDGKTPSRQGLIDALEGQQFDPGNVGLTLKFTKGNHVVRGRTDRIVATSGPGQYKLVYGPKQDPKVPTKLIK